MPTALETHRHVVLARLARTEDTLKYPEKFCEELVKATKLQKHWYSKWVKLIAAMQKHRTEEGTVEDKQCAIYKVPYEEVEHDVHGDDTDIAWHEISGKHLDPARVQNARAAEMEYYKKMGVYVKVPTLEFLARTGQ